MTLDELIRVFAEPLTTGVVLTDAVLDHPGPVIRYVNPAFCRLTGYGAEDLVGRNPRVLQGEATQALTLRSLSRALRSGRRFHGVLSNYRRSGELYLCEIDVRPIYGANGSIESFISFEREVARTRGRPREDDLGRFRPVVDADPIVTTAIPGVSPFST